MCGIVFAASTNVAVIVVAGFLLTAVSNIFSNGFHIYQAEIFPTAIRSTASGVCYSLSRATSTVMPFIAVPALAALGPVAVFSGSAVLIVLLCLDVGLLGPRSTGLNSNRSNRGRRLTCAFNDCCTLLQSASRIVESLSADDYPRGTGDVHTDVAEVAIRQAGSARSPRTRDRDDKWLP